MVRGVEIAARPAHRVSEEKRTSRRGLRWTESGGRGTESTKRMTTDTGRARPGHALCCTARTAS